ncbi:hypothetical protein Msil_2830 [Methylocella silvestris BL2]|uniref:Uncharacterized protein n=1 Tax=Methylocella silvestris (strain DSM 15510 / CIP 108128 / LMG 27833 / NCIMB 13906 / BL2) TaxID=395965 RepID=B8ETA6_METSB|nr:hypothetical protein [Methylocella silvestris]ACK51748.1 hypothetical protein Msil_2830 [Methylocella silvestris BL2]
MSATFEETQEAGRFSFLGDALGSAAGTVGAAIVTVGASTKAAAQKVQGGLGAGVYKAAYGVSYGVVFAGVFVTELLPENASVRRGFEEGADAARRAVATRNALPPSKRARPAAPRRLAAVAAPVKAPKRRSVNKTPKSGKIETASES